MAGEISTEEARQRIVDVAGGFRERQRGELDAAAVVGMDIGDYWIKQKLDAKGLEWTRDNYIRQKFRGELPDDWDESRVSER